MTGISTEKELTLIPELVAEANKLSDKNKERLLYIAQGILIAERYGSKG